LDAHEDKTMSENNIIYYHSWWPRCMCDSPSGNSIYWVCKQNSFVLRLDSVLYDICEKSSVIYLPDLKLNMGRSRSRSPLRKGDFVTLM